MATDRRDEPEDRVARKPFVGADATITVVAGGDLVNVGEFFRMRDLLEKARTDRAIAFEGGAAVEFGVVAVLKTWCPRWESIDALGLSAASLAMILDGLDLVSREIIKASQVVLDVHAVFARDPRLTKFDDLDETMRTLIMDANASLPGGDEVSPREAFARIAEVCGQFLVMYSMHYAVAVEFIRGTEASPAFSKFTSGRSIFGSKPEDSSPSRGGSDESVNNLGGGQGGASGC